MSLRAPTDQDIQVLAEWRNDPGQAVLNDPVMVRYAFEELGLHKVELEVRAFNTRAVRSYQKAGSSQEGLRRAAAFHHGRFIDAVNMGLLAEDYRSAQ